MQSRCYTTTATHKTLGVLPDNDEVDGSSVHPLDALDGADVGVQVQVLSQRDDGGRVPGDLVRWGRDRTEHGSVTFLLEHSGH